MKLHTLKPAKGSVKSGKMSLVVTADNNKDRNSIIVERCDVVRFCQETTDNIKDYIVSDESVPLIMVFEVQMATLNVTAFCVLTKPHFTNPNDDFDK